MEGRRRCRRCKLAEEGFVIDAPLAALAEQDRRRTPRGYPSCSRVYGKNGGKDDWQAGDRLVQKDLAKTLRLHRREGARRLLQGRDRRPARRGDEGRQRPDHQGRPRRATRPRSASRSTAPTAATTSTARRRPAPAASAWSQMLNILENFDLKKHGRYSPETLHLMAEAMRRAYCDRARHLGDPDFVKIPAHLTTKEYAKKLADGIDLKKATPSEDLAKDIPLTGEGDSTTHFSRHRQGRHGGQQHLHAGAQLRLAHRGRAGRASCSTTR